MHSSAAPAPRFRFALNDGVLGLSAVAILLAGVVVWSTRGISTERTDFALTYVGARIVHSGLGGDLYDPKVQVQLRDSMFQHPSPLYFEHPPFEALALAPLAALPFRAAYMTWGLINVTILLGVVVGLRSFLHWPSDDISYLFLWLIFVPLEVAIYQGQSSMLVLAAFALSFVELKKGNPFIAGATLGIALVKFQFAVPMAAIFLLRKQWRFFAGFSASAAVLAILSFVAVGWKGILDYIRLLSSIGSHPQNVSYGSAVDMPTLHGLIFALGGRHLAPTILNVIVSLLSFGLLAWIAWKWEDNTGAAASDLMFSTAIAAALLSGSHMFTHDFSPLAIGLFLAARQLRIQTGIRRLVLRMALIIFWTFPLYFLFVNWHCLFLMAGVLLVFAWSCVGSAEHMPNSKIFDLETVASG